MIDYKKTIKDWLKRSKKDRYWLADQCMVSKRAVDYWLSSAGVIPATKILIIENIIEKSKKVEADIDNTECTIIVKMQSDQFEQYNKDALALGMTFSEYMLYAVELLNKNEHKLERPLPYVKSPQGGRIDDNIIWGKRPKGDIA